MYGIHFWFFCFFFVFVIYGQTCSSPRSSIFEIESQVDILGGNCFSNSFVVPFLVLIIKNSKIGEFSVKIVLFF